MKLKEFTQSSLASVICNIFLAYVVFMLARITFFFINFQQFAPYMTWDLFFDMTRGALVFDTTAIIYVNAIYILMMLFPLHLKESETYYKIAKYVYIILNAMALCANFCDSVYFQYTGRRTSATVFSEFSNENNITSIILKETVNHWWLFVIFAFVVAGMWFLYRNPKPRRPLSLAFYYITHVVTLVVFVGLSIVGVRGGIGKAVRPITISNANQYVNRPIEASLVLNTPFSIIRTIGKKAFVTPTYMPDKEMEQTFSPLHSPTAGKPFTPKNVVVIILESFGKEYSAWFNSDKPGYKGYTPFLDSLAARSLTFKYSFANGHKSIDGMPSVLSSIPMFIEPFFLTPASLNKVSGIAGELDSKNYYTAFFHGAPNGSMGFEAFARASGFKHYFGMTEYKDDKDSGYKSSDFDGTWAIWDEQFLRFYADKMSSFKEPFMTAVFTASSHNPFAIPAEYAQRFPEGSMPIQKCISYSDMALKKFFERASHTKWFSNTLFVITADHTNQTERPEYQNDFGTYSVPIIFYAPGDSTLQGYNTESIAQQIDIMPTVLGYLGYDKPYVAFGNDLITTPADKCFAVNYPGVYQYVSGDYVMYFDGNKVTGIYNFKNDSLLKTNLVGKVPQQNAMEHILKAMVQQYMQRMNSDRLTAR